MYASSTRPAPKPVSELNVRTGTGTKSKPLSFGPTLNESGAGGAREREAGGAPWWALPPGSESEKYSGRAVGGESSGSRSGGGGGAGAAWARRRARRQCTGGVGRCASPRVEAGTRRETGAGQ